MSHFHLSTLKIKFCLIYLTLSSVQFNHSVMSDSLRPHGPQHARPPCPSPTLRAYSNSCPLSRWCRPTISSSVAPSPPASRDTLSRQLWPQCLHGLTTDRPGRVGWAPGSLFLPGSCPSGWGRFHAEWSGSAFAWWWDFFFFPPFQLKYCWFSMLGQFQVNSKVIQLETHTHTHIFFFHIFFHYRLWLCWIQFPILYSRSCWLSSLYIVVQLCLTLFDPMDYGMPGFPVLPCLPGFAQTHVHGVSDAIQPSHPLMPPCPPALNLVVCIY